MKALAASLLVVDGTSYSYLDSIPPASGIFNVKPFFSSCIDSLLYRLIVRLQAAFYFYKSFITCFYKCSLPLKCCGSCKVP